MDIKNFSDKNIGYKFNGVRDTEKETEESN